MKEEKRLIITADDYGMAPSVNRAIEEGMAAGLITSTNVMMNMEYCAGAAELKKKFPDISVGIHFTLSAGRPLLPAAEIPTLTDADGNFFSYPQFRKRYRAGKIDNRDILRELAAQYDKFTALCGLPDYWNTHQNVHVDMKIFHVFLDFAHGRGIDRMRTHQRIYIPAKSGAGKSLAWKIGEAGKVFLLNRWMKRAHAMGVRSADGLVVNSNKAELMDIGYSLSHIDWKGRRTGELVIHPATDADCVYFGSIRERRIQEYRLFTDPKTRTILAENEIRLIHFGQL